MSDHYVDLPLSGSGSGVIISINGDTTPAQLIVGGTGISVSTSAGTTTITNTLPGPTGSGTNDRIVRWDGTTAIQDSLVGISDTGQIYYTTETTTYWARTSANVWDFVQSNNRLFRLDNGVTFYDPASVTRNINYSFSTTAAFLSLVGGIKEHVFTGSSTADTIVSIANTSSGGDTWSFYSSGSASGQGGPGDFSLRNSSLTPININTKAAMLLGAPSVSTDGKRNAVTCIGLDTTGIGGTTTANATTSITGSGTTFNTSLGVGDRISLSSASSTYSTVKTVASNTSATVDTAIGNGTSQTINRKRAIHGWLDASGTPVMLLNDLGRLLIGNVSSYGSPQYLLDVQGTVGTSSSIVAGTRITSGVVTISDSATPTLDASLGDTFYLSSTQNCTMTVTNMIAGQRIILAYKATSATRTLSFDSSVSIGTDVSAPTGTTSGSTDLIALVYQAGVVNKPCLAAIAKGFT